MQSISGGVAKQVELFLNDKKLKAWATDGPYEVTIPMTEYSRGEFLRATAIGDDGKEANDLRFLKGPSTTIESVRVDVVQLHVSAVDKEQALRQGPDRNGLLGPGGRPAAEGHGLRGRREAAADDRTRRRRLGVDGEGHALRARRLHRALPGPDARKGQGLRHRVPRAAPHAPVAHQRLAGAAARRRRDLRARRDGALRLGRARPLPVPRAAGPQGARRRLRRRRQPLPRRLRDAAALLPDGGRADLLHRGQPLGPRLRHPRPAQRDRARVRRRGLLHLERREDRRK